MEETYHRLLDKLKSEEFAEYNLDIFDAESVDINTIVNSAASFPFMASRRTVVVR
ncbi:MAG: polymerase delta subunit, partial [Bacteroidota bacterium]|nr:polymerase delta subunit [Bacteroidota bacterium]